MIKMEIMYSIYKQKWMSYTLILSMQLITYLLMMMTIICINIMRHFYHQRIMKIYLLGQKYVSAKIRACRNKKIILDLHLNKSKSFECQVSFRTKNDT